MNVIVLGSVSLTYFLLITANNAAKKALIKPTPNPNNILPDNPLTTKIIPGTMANPKNTSNRRILDLKYIGSKNAVKKDAVDMATRATEALAYFIEPKKVTQ